MNEEEQKLFEERLSGARASAPASLARGQLRAGAWDHMLEAIARDPFLSHVVDVRRGEIEQEGLDDRSDHTCGREYGWSLFAANRCDGCAMQFLRGSADIIGLARACTGLDGIFQLHGINYKGAPSEKQEARCVELWKRLHGGGP